MSGSSPDLGEPVKVSAVSYINSYPFIHGLRSSGLAPAIDLSLVVPSECARKVVQGEAHVGLMPVAELPQVEGGHVITDMCIGADGPVETVCLYSEVPLKDVRTVLLDPESRTSVRLVQLLARYHWHIRPQWNTAEAGFEGRIHGTTAGVVIGDRAFALNNQHSHVFDLAHEWRVWTGLPFVFAAWVANRPLEPDFTERFAAALRWGVDHRSQAVRAMLPPAIDPIPKMLYVQRSISYELDHAKQEAMRLFLRL
jgi:chorismate dehydratase